MRWRGRSKVNEGERKGCSNKNGEQLGGIKGNE